MNLLVSTEDKYLLEKYRWFVKSNGYVTAKIDGKLIMLHRLIMGARLGQEIDHINRNKLDNRRENLRFSDRYKNMKNAKYKPGLSGIVGVTKHSDHWTARRRVNGAKIHLGCFPTIEEAKKAYESVG